MALPNQVSEVCSIFLLLIRSLVGEPGAVTIDALPSAGGMVVLRVLVAEVDKGKLIGKEGRTARSLRIILNAIAKEHGLALGLDIV